MVSATKEKILAATLNLIKSEGIEGVTIRKIASAAGANVALVNYYFGSKEKLISETLKLQLASFKAAFAVFDDESGLPPIAKLKRFLLSYTVSLQEHPELIKRLLVQDHLFESQTEYAEFLMGHGLDKVLAVITELIGPASRDKLLLVTQQMFGAILSPIIKASFDHKHEAMPDDSFRISASIEEQIDLFLDHYFHQYIAH